MIEIHHLKVRAGDLMVKADHLIIPKGHCHVLLGATGNGKTVLLETIAGFRKPVSGSIRMDGHEVSDQPSNMRRIGYVPQELSLFSHLSVRENIYYSWRFKKEVSSAFKFEMDDICSILKIDRLMDRKTENLSGGERQRVALARALANDHKFLLLDEPFSALHQTLKIELWSMLKDLKNKYDLTILLVTHDLDECFFLADEISVIHEGSILQTGTKDEVMKRPTHKCVADLIGGFVYLEVDGCKEDRLRAIRSEDIEFISAEASPEGGVLMEGIVETIHELRESYHIMIRIGEQANRVIGIESKALQVRVHEPVRLFFGHDKIFMVMAEVDQTGGGN